jgi:DNA-directed RNA polymerase subunit N (RpoN/RPB10)
LFDSETKMTTRIIITYPEDNIGYDLISCLSCGQIYAIDISKEVYIGPQREEKLKTVNCIQCGKILAETAALYPEKYRLETGKILEWKRDMEIPNDHDAIIEKVNGIY